MQKKILTQKIFTAILPRLGYVRLVKFSIGRVGLGYLM